MNLLTIISILIAVLYLTVETNASCADCQQSGHYVEANGYRCLDLGGNNAICTCPGGTRYEFNKPCRLCEPSGTTPPVCNKDNSRYAMCLETNDYGGSYVCLCQDASGNAYTTTDYNCDPAATVSTAATTTTAPVSPGTICQNGGEFVNGACQCPSGFSGPICGTSNSQALCDRVTCKNNGVCAIRNPNGPFEAVCLCRFGTWGDFCELTGTLGSCSPNFCSNNGACVENVVGTTRHAYCRCPPGYNGDKCQTQYFKCEKEGRFVDQPMFDQGKYFKCTPSGGSFKIEQKSCAKGLRFNAHSDQCTY